MIDFQKELDKLLADEPDLSPCNALSAALDEGRKALTALQKTQNDISMQVEEIYDIVQDTGTLEKTFLEEKASSERLLGALVGLSDILEDFYAFAVRHDSDLAAQARMMWKNAGKYFELCAVTRLGAEGEPLNPAIHHVRSAAPSRYPLEHIAYVLQSGYRYKGAVLRKASVIVSTGKENDGNE